MLRLCRGAWLLATAAMLAISPAPAAQQPASAEQGLEALLRSNARPIVLSHGELSGAGFDLLMEAADKAQFFALGEQHNGKEIPEFTAALFSALNRRQGFTHLALEQDPLAARLTSAAPARGRLPEIVALARRYPNAFTFVTDQELEMIAEAGRVRSKGRAVWGLDQAFGATHYLDRLVEIAPNRAIRDRTVKLAQLARQAEAERLKPGARFMTADVEKSAEFLALRSFYSRRQGSEADYLITQLFKSLAIYRDWWTAVKQGQLTRYRQSHEREENMKRLFMTEYRTAQAAGESLPKVLLKFGHFHTIRGPNASGILTLGNFVSEFATSNGSRSFHLAMYANNDRPGYFDILSGNADNGPLMRAASPSGWAIVDLRPLRPMVFQGRIESLTAEQRDLIFGFDAVLLIGSATRGTYWRTGLRP